jgi:hypothetical protein
MIEGLDRNFAECHTTAEISQAFRSPFAGIDFAQAST